MCKKLSFKYLYALVALSLVQNGFCAGQLPDLLRIEQERSHALELSQGWGISLVEVKKRYKVMSENVSDWVVTLKLEMDDGNRTGVFTYRKGHLVCPREVEIVNKDSQGQRINYSDNGVVSLYETLPYGPNIGFYDNGDVRFYNCVSNWFFYDIGYEFDRLGRVTFSRKYLTPQPVHIVK